jgi:hypothetical protein
MEGILMRAPRALALLATTGVMLVATAGAALLGSGAATAAPAPAPSPPVAGGPQSYPPPPPVFTTNRGTVKVGQKARVSGNHFGYVERVTLTIVYQPSGRRAVIVVTTDRFGRFGASVTLRIAGSATITAFGRTSHFSASVTITVRRKRGPRAAAAAPSPTGTLSTYNPLVLANGPVGLAGGGQGAGNGNADLVANSNDLTPGGSQFPLGAVGGAVALIAGVLLTLLAFRRRRAETDS